jgi:Chitobiase/beta-hexosaminidase C-terminal domain
MVAINITITESKEQIVSGIPRRIFLSSNIIATIFYTIDGSDPDTSSEIYLGSIVSPNYNFTLKVFASNGSVNSPIITETYATSIVNNTRLPRAAVDGDPSQIFEDLYPFGTNAPQPELPYLNPSKAGVTVNDPTKEQFSNAFDADGYATTFTNLPFNSENYSILYSEKNARGETGPNIGTIPAKVTSTPVKTIPEQSNQFSKLFDPRALVIFQDLTKENPNDPPVINKEFFSLEGDHARDGMNRFTSGLDSEPLTGSFIRSHHNPRDNTITYYYRDSRTNRWIISKSAYIPNGTFDGNLSTSIIGNRKPGSRFIFTWNPYRGRFLF